MISLGHIALFVADLRQAESFYRHIFGMQLLMRETEQADSLWYTLPPDKGWQDAEAADIELGMVALRREEFVLALFQGRPAAQDSVLEIGINMEAGAIAAVRQRLPAAVEIINHEYGDFLFNDPYGYRWHLWPAGQPFQSNGQSSGRWLQL